MKKITTLFILFVLINQSFSQNIYELIEKNEYGKVKDYNKPLNIYNSSETTPFMWAVYKSDLKMVKLLISKGADPKMKSWLKYSIKYTGYLYGSNFVLAAGENKIKILKFLLKKGYFSIDENEYNFYNRDIKNGWNALQWAAFKNNIEIIRYLIKQGADINSLTEVNDNQSSLLLALNYGKTEAAVELINLDADVNIRDVYDNSSIKFALDLKNRELVKLIYNSGFKFKGNEKTEYTLQLKKLFEIDSFELL